MKFLKDILFNPLWLFEFTSKRAIMAAIAGGLASGAGSAAIGGLFSDDPEVIPVEDPRELARRGVDIRESLFPSILNLRNRFDPQFLRADQAQTQRAIDSQRNFLEGDILQSIRNQRGDLFTSDMNQFTENLNRFASPFRQGLEAVSPELKFGAQGVQRDQDLLNILRDQLATDLPLQGRLDARGRRSVEQATGSQIGRQGRGNLFGVGQLALNTESAERAREGFNLSKLFNTIGAGGQVDQRGLSISDRFTNPFLNLLNSTQSANRQLVGSPLQQLGFAQATGRAAQQDIPLFDPNLMNLEALKQGQSISQAGFTQGQNNQMLDLFGGGFAGGSQLFGRGDTSPIVPARSSSTFLNSNTGFNPNLF